MIGSIKIAEYWGTKKVDVKKELRKIREYREKFKKENRITPTPKRDKIRYLVEELQGKGLLLKTH